MRRAAATLLVAWILAPIAGAALPSDSGTMAGMECCVRMGDTCECRVFAGMTRCPEGQALTPPRFVAAALAPAPPTPELRAGESLTNLSRPEPSSFLQPPSTPPPRA